MGLRPSTARRKPPSFRAGRWVHQTQGREALPVCLLSQGPQRPLCLRRKRRKAFPREKAPHTGRVRPVPEAEALVRGWGTGQPSI